LKCIMLLAPSFLKRLVIYGGKEMGHSMCAWIPKVDTISNLD